MTDPAPAPRSRLSGLAIAALSTVFSLLLAEGLLRLIAPYSAFGGAMELAWMREYRQGFGEVMTTDPELGFRPNLGNGIYSEYGTLVDGWDVEPRAGATRVLFVGDSVTQRGKIVKPLRRLYGTRGVQYWNAGVGSFNTVQEVGFYRRYNAKLEPDHVVLFFHLNDFETTPIAFFSDGELISFAPNRPIHTLDPWLFRNSSVYRAYIGLRISRSDDREKIRAEVEASLRGLADELARDGIRFSVVVLPHFQPVSEWHPNAVANRARITAFLQEIGVRHFDLFEPTQAAIAEGVDVQESPGDFWHPSDAAGRRLARYLFDAGLLGPSPPP